MIDIDKVFDLFKEISILKAIKQLEAELEAEKPQAATRS